MSQISPPIRILLVAVIGLCAAYMLFLRPKEEAVPAATPAAATAVPAKDPNATTNSKPGSAVNQAVRGADTASARADAAAGGAIADTEGGVAADPATGVNTNPATAAPATGETVGPAGPHQGGAAQPAEGRPPPRQEPQGARAALLQQPLLRRQGRAPRARPRRPLRQAGLRRRPLDQVGRALPGDHARRQRRPVADRRRHRPQPQGGDARRLRRRQDDRPGRRRRAARLGRQHDQGPLLPPARRDLRVGRAAGQGARAARRRRRGARVPRRPSTRSASTATPRSAAIKPPKKHAAFHQAFYRGGADEHGDRGHRHERTRRRSPAQLGEHRQGGRAQDDRVEKKFLAQHSTHGLSCF